MSTPEHPLIPLVDEGDEGWLTLRAMPGAERTTTIGAEKRGNPLLAAPDEDTFVRELLAGLGSYPGYFARLTERNRKGPAVLPATPPLRALDAAEVRALLAEGGYVVDVRPAAGYASGHIPGAISIPLREQFATWLGRLLPDTAPLAVVTGPATWPEDPPRLRTGRSWPAVAESGP